MLNDISTQHNVELYWTLGHAGVRGNEIADKLARDDSVQKFVGPEPSLWDSRRSIRRQIRHWLDNQHWARRQGLGSTQRQDLKLISVPSLGAKTRLLSFNRTQCRAVIGLRTGHSTLRRHLHSMSLTNSSLCGRCGVQDETSAHILCDCKALASLRHVYQGSFSWI